MIRFDWNDPAARGPALARPAARVDATMMSDVRGILDTVRDERWNGLGKIARSIDGSAPECVEIAAYAERAKSVLPAKAQRAMRLAADAVTLFHERTRPETIEVITTPGLSVSKAWRPLDRVGLYVPGGRAPLFSTLMMLAIPARVAGVGAIVVVTPPRPEGGLDGAVALAAELCGIDRIWTVGGAQAIAALAYGAGDIPAVDRICGPGNAWVAAAKAMVSAEPGGPGIDLPAGPSELMVVAGKSGDAGKIAADLLSQAEHGPEAQVILVSSDAALIEAVEEAVMQQSATLAADLAPVRAILCADLDQAVDIANAYAPEHLSLACGDAAARVEAVRNAGAVFVGSAAAESFGDYLAGSSHVLPTDGAARFTGGVSTMTFMKAMTVQRLTPTAADALAAPAAALARLEGLEAHARAAEARIKR